MSGFLNKFKGGSSVSSTSLTIVLICELELVKKKLALHGVTHQFEHLLILRNFIGNYESRCILSQIRQEGCRTRSRDHSVAEDVAERDGADTG